MTVQKKENFETWFGTAAEMASFTGMMRGDSYIQTDAETEYIYNGSSWQPKDGTDATAAAQEIGGKGMRGWLSGIYYVLKTAGIKVTTLPSLVFAAGNALIGKVGIDQVTANANEVVTKTGSVTTATLSAETTKVIGTVNDKVADGDNIALGTKADAAATVADTTPFSVIALLKGLWNKLAGTLTVQLTGSITGKETSANFTRPNDTNDYLALDVVGSSPGANLTFSNVLANAGGTFAILSAKLRIDVSAVPSGMSGFRLHLYNAAPTAIADNDPYNLPAADRAKYLGYITLSNPSDLGDTLCGQDEGVNFVRKLAEGSTTLYGILQTIGAYTPTAQSVKTITLETVPM
jgi:hypothetical protein